MSMTVGGHSIDMLRNTLYSAVLSDVLDDLGYRKQTLDPGIRPIDERFIMAGRAFTVVTEKVYDIPREPYKLQMEAVDAIRPGEVFVVSACNSNEAAFWGELLSTACLARGGTGAVIDGLCRDSSRIREMGFPVFSRGYRPTDSKGRLDVVNYGIPFELGGVRVHPGDFIFGDHDGIIVVPKSIEQEAVERALAKVSGENLVRKALQEGMSCTEAFQRFGIL
jgi:4-hydroxy-4-methyl-2-oxoglutarate aldolase